MIPDQNGIGHYSGTDAPDAPGLVFLWRESPRRKQAFRFIHRWRHYCRRVYIRLCKMTHSHVHKFAAALRQVPKLRMD